jgi:hypothetical protein
VHLRVTQWLHATAQTTWTQQLRVCINSCLLDVSIDVDSARLQSREQVAFHVLARASCDRLARSARLRYQNGHGDIASIFNHTLRIPNHEDKIFLSC